RRGPVSLFRDEIHGRIEDFLFSLDHCNNLNERLNYMFETNVCQRNFWWQDDCIIFEWAAVLRCRFPLENGGRWLCLKESRDGGVSGCMPTQCGRSTENTSAAFACANTPFPGLRRATPTMERKATVVWHPASVGSQRNSRTRPAGSPVRAPATM